MPSSFFCGFPWQCSELVLLLLSPQFPFSSGGSSLMFFCVGHRLPSSLLVRALPAMAGSYFSGVCSLSHPGFWATVWLLLSFPRRFLCFRCLACVLFGPYFLSSLGLGLAFVLRRLLRDSVESQFLRDWVLPLGRVCSVGCGFSVCAVFVSLAVCLWSFSYAGLFASGFRPL